MGDNLLAALIAASILLGISGAAGGVYANFKSTALEASNRRLTTDNDYYLKKVAYQDGEIARLNEKCEHLDRENDTFRTLINPAAEIGKLREQEKTNHGETLAALQQIHTDLLSGARVPGQERRQ